MLDRYSDPNWYMAMELTQAPVLILTDAHIYAFLLGWVIGMIASGVLIWIQIPGMVQKGFDKARRDRY